MEFFTDNFSATAAGIMATVALLDFVGVRRRKRKLQAMGTGISSKKILANFSHGMYRLKIALDVAIGALYAWALAGGAHWRPAAEVLLLLLAVEFLLPSRKSNRQWSTDGFSGRNTGPMAKGGGKFFRWMGRRF
jgi:hypothetical protein